MGDKDSQKGVSTLRDRVSGKGKYKSLQSELHQVDGILGGQGGSHVCLWNAWLHPGSNWPCHWGFYKNMVNPSLAPTQTEASELPTISYGGEGIPRVLKQYRFFQALSYFPQDYDYELNLLIRHSFVTFRLLSFSSFMINLTYWPWLN